MVAGTSVQRGSELDGCRPEKAPQTHPAPKAPLPPVTPWIRLLSDRHRGSASDLVRLEDVVHQISVPLWSVSLTVCCVWLAAIGLAPFQKQPDTHFLPSSGMLFPPPGQTNWTIHWEIKIMTRNYAKCQRCLKYIVCVWNLKCVNSLALSHLQLMVFIWF